MAHNNLKVLLGFEDEFILEKHNTIVNYTTNKIGGTPDWPITVDIKTPLCPLCELPRPLILQIYAPLDNSTYHRTLYLFACINPNCWNQNESWICLRSQILEQNSEVANVSTVATNNSLTVTDWCQDADDWDDNSVNNNEENGNLINSAVHPDHPSDDEEESCSFEEAVRSGLGQLTVDDRNANTGAIVADLQGGGAVGRQNSPTATAEIEVDESELVTIDTPLVPQHDIAALLQEVAPLPQELYQKAQNDGASASILQFLPSFVSVGEENASGHIQGGVMVSDHHIRDLLQEYQQNNEDADLMHVEPAQASQNDLATLEKYEKSAPAHGDKMFHHFLTKIQMNPGQILRYSRGGPPPLLVHPLQDVPKKCKHCQSDLGFELQILPTMIPKLRLQRAEEIKGSRIEFGTVLVFTCNRSCWSSDSKVREEVVVVQSEKY